MIFIKVFIVSVIPVGVCINYVNFYNSPIKFNCQVCLSCFFPKILQFGSPIIISRSSSSCLVRAFSSEGMKLQSLPKLLGRSALPPSPQFNVEISSFRSSEVIQLCTGKDYMNSSVWEWSTAFVVSILSMIVDYEAAFQLILTRIFTAGRSITTHNSDAFAVFVLYFYT